MLVKHVKNKLPEKLYSSLEFEKFRPSQSKSIKAGLLDGKNMLVCSPTASGKTLIAELAGIKKIMEEGGKMVYIVPLKALASEKATEFKEKYDSFGITTALSIGDPDSNESWLSKKDIIVCTSEKFDSLLRHNITWLNQIKTIIIDEIHLLNDMKRGPTLEIIITLMKKIARNAQIIGLSATIGNPKELSEWLDAELIEDKWRPVKLFQGSFHENEIDFFGAKNNVEISRNVSETTLRIASDTIKMGKQALIFCPTKRSAEATAEKIAKLIKEVSENTKISNKILSAPGSATRQCRRLSKIIKSGIAFHHSGLINIQRKVVEDGFKENKIKIICCTPTLAMGVNLPAFRVIMKSLKRFTGRGMDWIPVLEYHQMTGRAGRPNFNDSYGEAISIAISEKDKEFIHEKYIQGEPEDIVSKLSVEPVLRSAVLSLVASGFVKTESDLISFFKKTLYGFQYDDDHEFQYKVESAIEKIVEFEFISQKEDKLEATALGRRVSELYISPDAAFQLITGLNKLPSTFPDISLLHLIASNWEMAPWTNIQKRDYDWLENSVEEIVDSIIGDVPKQWDWEYEQFLKKCKTCFMINEWINETPEEFLFDEYNVSPGELRNLISKSDWLLYGISELSKLTDNLNKFSSINKIKFRVKNGIKEELAPLVNLRGIGRVRARKLYRAGLRSIIILRKTELTAIAQIVGKRVAENIKKQVGTKIIRDFDPELDERFI